MAKNTGNPFHDIAGNEALGKLEADDAGMKLGDVKLFTIRRAFKHHFSGDEYVDRKTGALESSRAETKLIVEFVEFPGKGLTCNKTQGNAFAALASKGFLPLSFDEITQEFQWGGVRVPLVARNFEFEKKQYVKLCPVSSETFAEQMEKLGAAKPTPRTTRRPAARGR
ncbi:MAG: hypothetical protein WC729_30065 [Sphingomonas sp.]|jgi:hypothetical protein|uniref:hypothetical protein n=1 Tax=Sphingomonas sp. TaxID=28214 RepID=UPI003566B71C